MAPVETYDREADAIICSSKLPPTLLEVGSLAIGRFNPVISEALGSRIIPGTRTGGSRSFGGRKTIH
jgi:hypothetical protein